MQRKPNFAGVIAPVLTPFGEDGGPDAERFVEHGLRRACGNATAERITQRFGH